MALPDHYLAALARLGPVFADYRARTGSDAVLVGGAAVAIYTSGQFPSADFDIVAGRDEAFAEAMQRHGFRPEDREGYLRVGYYHPDDPFYGFQLVSGRLFDGQADCQRLVRLRLRAHGEATLPAIEDMIADRLGQYAVASPTDQTRLMQARALFNLAESLDMAYLKRRVEEEGGDPALLDASPARGGGDD
jgi:hypothetical protein